MTRAPQRRRLLLSLLASLVLHLLLIWAYQRWAAAQVEHLLRPVRYERPPAVPRLERPPVRTPRLPEVAFERRRVRPERLPAPALEEIGVPPPPPIEIPSGIGTAPLPLGERGRYEPPVDSLPTLEQIEREVARLRAESRAGYARLWTPDADTGDVVSRRRRLARQIVLAAVEAMGGATALTEVRDMAYQGRYHKAYGPRSMYARMLPGGARLVFDGERGFVDLFGERHALAGAGLRQVRQRAERWDFLSRYLGDGVRLTYAGLRRRGVEARRQLVLVEDLRFGGRPFVAVFDAASHLLLVEEFFERHPRYEVQYRDYGPVQRATLWRQLDVVRHTNADGTPVYRFARSSYPVGYGEIDETLFILSRRDTSVQPLLPEPIFGRTLWLEVRVALRATGRPVLDGAQEHLAPGHRERVRRQVEAVVSRYVRRRTLFGGVRAVTKAWLRQDLPPRDLVLSVTVAQGYYRARLFTAGEYVQIMQDGPTSAPYAQRHPRECGSYATPLYAVDGELAYTSPGQLEGRLLHTCEKVRATVEALEAGEEHFPYARACCYCQPPRVVKECCK